MSHLLLLIKIKRKKEKKLHRFLLLPLASQIPGYDPSICQIPVSDLIAFICLDLAYFHLLVAPAHLQMALIGMKTGKVFINEANTLTKSKVDNTCLYFSFFLVQDFIF